jgi:hypothetical protein
MGVHRMTATELPHDGSAIDTGGFTATVGEFDASEGHGDWHHHGDHHIVAYIVSGNVRVESGPDGNVLTEAGPMERPPSTSASVFGTDLLKATLARRP